MNNMMIMSNTFDLLSKYKKPFLFASSQMSNMLYSNYGLLKLIGERITSTLNGNFVKLWNVYGIENDTTKSHVITDFVLKALKFKKIQMLTNGKESREFLYADDCCEALWVLSRSYDQIQPFNDRSYDITSHKWTTILELAELIQKISGCKIKVGTKKDQTQQNAMNEPNLRMNQWWQPNYSLFEGIRELWNVSKE